MVTLITAMFSALLGAWVNNIFTWKIKNKIEAADSLYNCLWKLDFFFHRYIKLSHENLNEIHNVELRELQYEINILIRTLHLHDAVLDDKFGLKIAQYTNIVIKVVNNKLLYTKYVIQNIKSKESEEYESAREFFNEILSYRKELSSFCYMLKQLNPCNIRCQKNQ